MLQHVHDSRTEGKLWEDTFPLLSKDGQYCWFLSRAVPIRDFQGKVVRWFGTSTDISAQIAAEEEIRNLNSELQERVAELEAIMQVLPVGVAVSQDLEGHVITTNVALSNLLDLKPGDTLSADATAPEDASFEIYADGALLARQDHPLLRSARTGQQLGSLELEFRYPGKDPVHLLASASPLFDQKGNARGAVGAFIDVSGRKQLEDLLRERADLLELATEAIFVRDLNGVL